MDLLKRKRRGHNNNRRRKDRGEEVSQQKSGGPLLHKCGMGQRIAKASADHKGVACKRIGKSGSKALPSREVREEHKKNGVVYEGR